MSNFYETCMTFLEKAIQQYGNAAALSRATGIKEANISRWKNRLAAPRLTEIAPIFDLIGMSPSQLPSDTVREVSFICADSGSNAAPPESSDYIAYPLVGEVGAGAGYLPQDVIEGWCMLPRNSAANLTQKNLIAVRIGERSTSMQPTLRPGDVVLINRQDIDAVTHTGKIMLVLDPDGAGMIKRVAAYKHGEDYQLVFYSDNLEYPPLVYSLKEDYLGDFSRAIVGRAIWSWSDIRQK